MVKHAQAISCEQSTNCLSEFDHFMRLALKGLRQTLKLCNSAMSVQWFKSLKCMLSFSIF